MAVLANSEKLSGTRPFFSMNIRSCTVNCAWMAPWRRSWTGLAGCTTIAPRFAGGGFAGAAGEAASFVGSRYSDSICAVCSGVSCEAPAAGDASFLPQPQRARRLNARMKTCWFMSPIVGGQSLEQGIGLCGRRNSLQAWKLVAGIAAELWADRLDVAIREVHIASFVVAERE